MGDRGETIRLTLAERNHLLALLEERTREGSYSGNREQYWVRHKRIVEKLFPKDRSREP